MFNSKDYWKRRKNPDGPLRGQGDEVNIKVIEKGQDVPYVTRSGKKSLYPNAEGSHMIRLGRGFKLVSRKESRRLKFRDRSMSKPGAKHSVNPPNHRFTFPTRNPKITNHLAHRERQVIRELNRQPKEDVK